MKVTVVGAGGIGRQIAEQLSQAGHAVVLASRSGTGADTGAGDRPHVRTARVDAADPHALSALSQGADVLVNAVNPPYTRWARQWPSLAVAFLAAAERSGAGLITIGNLYGYGPTATPMTEATPLASTGVKGAVRAQMWRDALQAHQQGRLRAVELRASDYFGPGAGAGVSYLNRFAIAPAVNGKVARHLYGDLDAPHSWTYLPDIARLAVAVAQTDPSGADWGRPWHVPTAAPASLREVAVQAAQFAGTRIRQPALMPTAMRGVLQVVPLIRELKEMAYQLERPFVLDSSAAQERFDLLPVPWSQALEATVRWAEKR